MYLYWSVFMISSHLGVIHVTKRIHTFSIWGGGSLKLGGIDAGARFCTPPPLSVFLVPFLKKNIKYFERLFDGRIYFLHRNR